jgi:hypothetical protein
MRFAFQLLKKISKNTFGYVSKKKIDSFYTISDIETQKTQCVFHLETQMRFLRFYAYFCVFLPKRSLFLLDMPFFKLLDYF